MWSVWAVGSSDATPAAHPAKPPAGPNPVGARLVSRREANGRPPPTDLVRPYIAGLRRPLIELLRLHQSEVAELIAALEGRPSA